MTTVEGHELYGTTYYEIETGAGRWSFDESDLDLNYIDGAIAAWGAFREFAVKELARRA